MKKISKIDLLLFLIFFFNFYTAKRVYITTNIFVPYYFIGIIGCYFLFINIRKINFNHIRFLIIIYTITLLGGILSPSIDEFLSKRIIGLIQIIYSTIISYGYYLMLNRYDKKSLANLFLLIIFLIIISSIIELTIYRFTNIINSDRINPIFNVSRANLFGDEASYVAMMYLFALNGWYSLTNNKNKLIHLILFTVLGYILIYSPFVFLSLIMAVIFNFSFNKSHVITFQKLFIKYFKLILTLTLFVVFLFVFAGSRISDILSLSERSAIIRFFAPPIIMLETLFNYPFWGVGVSSILLVEDIIINIYINYFGFDISYRGEDSYLTNSFFSMIIFYGIIGSTLIYYTLKYFSKSLGAKNWSYIFFGTLILSQTYGAFVTPPIWIMYLTLVVISKNNIDNYYQFSSYNPKEVVKIRYS